MTELEPLTDAELRAAREAQDRRTLSLRSRGWNTTTPYDRHDVETNFRINQWLMRQGKEPEA